MSLNTFGQNYRLIALPLGTKDSLFFNFGVEHKLEYSAGELAYTDTNVANYFFEQLAKFVDVKKIILVTEEKANNDIIQIDPSIWITKTMKSLGFNRWISADTRTSDAKWSSKSQTYLMSFLNQYCDTKFIKTKRDTLGLFSTSITIKKEYLDAVADSVVSCLTAVKEIQVFEKNILRICSMLKKQGYIPVVVAGKVHVMSLGLPCQIQIRYKKEKMLDNLYSDIFMIRGQNFLMERFKKNK